MKTFRQYVREVEQEKVLRLAAIYVTDDGHEYQRLNEDRKWVNGRFQRNLGIDQPTSGAGQVHAHVLGRKGKELVIVNFDGTASHGTKGKLNNKDATALRKLGFAIRDDNLVEWWVIGTTKELLFG